MENLFSLTKKLGSTQLQNIVENLAQESAVEEGRTVIDFKLYDRILFNDGFVSESSGVITAKTGVVQLPQLTKFFNKTADGKTLQALMLQGNTHRINNLVLDGKADEPYRFDRLAVDVEVFDCEGAIDPDSGDPVAGLKAIGGASEDAMQVAKQIMQSGKLVLNVNGRDLNYAEPLGFAGSSIAIDGTRIVNVYNKKTPKFVDPAIFLPETTSFFAQVEMIEPVIIPANISVAITVSLLGYKFLKNA